MTRKFSDGHPKVLPACNFLSQYYFYNIFLQKSSRFALQTLTKFEAAKTGSGVGLLRLTAVCSVSGGRPTADRGAGKLWARDCPDMTKAICVISKREGMATKTFQNGGNLKLPSNVLL